jgi:hypothetical protein
MESIADAVWWEDCVGREDETTRGRREVAVVVVGVGKVE